MNIGTIRKLLSDKINLTRQIEKETVHYLNTLINSDWQKYPNSTYRVYVRQGDESFIVTFKPDSLSFDMTVYLATPGKTNSWTDVHHEEFTKLWKSLTKLAAFK